jgi:hypothetical protein
MVAVFIAQLLQLILQFVYNLLLCHSLLLHTLQLML